MLNFWDKKVMRNFERINRGLKREFMAWKCIVQGGCIFGRRCLRMWENKLKKEFLMKNSLH